jgi:Tol biopolymer transport system component
VSPERWGQITKVFEEALAQCGPERAAFVREACGSDADLKAQVESLLSAHEDAEDESQRWQVVPEPIESGDHLDHYVVLGKLGAGGMGDVYRARDERLGREVALKILLPELAGDDEFTERFRREARAASVLEHPNICRLYDIGEWQGRPFLTMELLEGETLREHMQKGPVEVNDILRVGMGVADALGVAHARGFCHRDIKPANVFLTCSGDVKVLDFGLAKRTRAARAAAPGEDVTLTSRRNAPGTPQYMSPEQILGDDVDSRTDTYSLGVVLYEMAAGRTPFTGASANEVFRKALAETAPPVSQLRRNLPRELDRILRRAIERDKDLRYQSALDLKAELKALLRELTVGPVPVSAAVPTRANRRWAWVAAVAIVLVAALVGAFLYRRATTPEHLPRYVALDASEGLKGGPVFSPQGDRIAFSWTPEGTANPSIFVKLVETGRAVRLTQTPSAEIMPAWSPDGSYLAFVRPGGPDAGYYIAGALGGGEQKVADLFVASNGILGRNLSWTPDGQHLVVADRMGAGEPVSIFTVSVRSRERQPLVQAKAGVVVANPAISPDGEWLAFTAGPNSDSGDLYARRLRDGATLRLTRDGRQIAGIAWTPDGKQLLFSSDRGGLFTIWRVDARGGTPELEPMAGPDAYQPSISRDGRRVAFVRLRENVNLWRIPLGPGKHEPAAWIRSTRHSVEPDVSPDGQRLAYASNRSGSWEIWVSDAESGGAGRGKVTTVSGGAVGSPRWSPDGQWIAYQASPSGQADLFLVAADGSARRQLTDHPANDEHPTWSADGRWLYFVSDRSGSPQIWRMSADGKGAPVALTRNGGEFAIEHNGWLLYSRGTELWRTHLLDGRKERLADGILRHDFAVAGDSVYFSLATDSEFTAVDSIHLREGRRQRVLAGIGPRAWGSLALTPDGEELIYDRMDQCESEIVVIER